MSGVDTEASNTCLQGLIKRVSMRWQETYARPHLLLLLQRLALLLLLLLLLALLLLLLLLLVLVVVHVVVVVHGGTAVARMAVRVRRLRLRPGAYTRSLSGST